ncbi:unnamed protein product, partial [Staurois parvus]
MGVRGCRLCTGWVSGDAGCVRDGCQETQVVYGMGVRCTCCAWDGCQGAQAVHGMGVRGRRLLCMGWVSGGAGCAWDGCQGTQAVYGMGVRGRRLCMEWLSGG